MKDAEIVAIGTEILLGDLVDTNTPWLSRKLAALGVAVHRHTTVGDDKECIVATFLEAALRADLVITVGGLGATPDDLTHECLREATSRELVEYSEARRHMDEVFERFAGRKPPPSAYKQAFFPEGSKLIPNPLGTAMGTLLEADGTLFATFPGVPTEMERMFEETLEPLIRRRSEGIIVSQTLRFAGISEEEMADKVRDLLGVADPTVAPLVGPGEVGVGDVDLRVTTRAITHEEAEKKMEPVVQEIISRLSGYYRGWQPQEGDTVRDEGIRTSETDPIQADFLPEDEVQTPGRLGMTFAPGMRTTGMRGRWERDLTADLRALEEEHETDVLVSLMEDHEYHGYRISELLEKDRIGSIKILRFAIKDMGVPREAESERFGAFVQDVVERLELGQNVVVHCRGGLGRTGTLAACVLVALGRHSADEAIAAVRATRKGTVQTREQEDFVRLFERQFGLGETRESPDNGGGEHHAR